MPSPIEIRQLVFRFLRDGMKPREIWDWLDAIGADRDEMLALGAKVSDVHEALGTAQHV